MRGASSLTCLETATGNLGHSEVTAAQGRACDLEDELALPRGNIFHRDLAWPFAEDESEAGGWGTETEIANVQLGGAGARRGGGVSGIPGRNAAMAILDQ